MCGGFFFVCRFLNLSRTRLRTFKLVMVLFFNDATDNTNRGDAKMIINNQKQGCGRRDSGLFEGIIPSMALRCRRVTEHSGDGNRLLILN